MTDKKVPLTGAQRAKRFYDRNKESERIRTNNYYKQKRIAQGFPPPKKQKSYTKQPDPIPPLEPEKELLSSSELIPVKSIKEKRQSRVKGINIKQKSIEPEPTSIAGVEQIAEPEQNAEPVSNEETPAFEKVVILINNIPNETKGNIKFRVDSFKTIIKILNTPLYKDFIKLITSKPFNVIKSLKEAEYRGKKYASRSILAYINCILFLLDKYPDIKISQANKRLYKDQSEILNYIADEQDTEKKEKLAETGALPSYDEYLNKVIETFGDDSREYLITELYKEIKARDNLVLKVVKTKAEAVDDDNYLIINEKPNAEVIINSFKTKKRHGEFEVKLSPSLTSFVRNYLKNNKIKYNQHLFNTKSLSVIVGRMNDKLGVKGYGATNVFRKMLETDLDKSGATPEQRLKLANELKHSMATAKKSYVIKKK